ncbi:MAG: hypothetical protein A2Y67_00715 [Candidatus Buchananbacteria bacterium RBG_13_39_9]|uniref:Uncharacterized protein n=1 Tax=Candidatus Buchananbacteria bacterium RBG_13_39_9 TaxID=1797531 RepID=A0A1G1XM76_9BACT|nr:MAG: hypothetical protein A2Y67_00715 [Candidatus Buchananbacteria bacterium RBG_13_39_9]
MTNQAQKWIPFRKLVRKDTYFNPCPVCGGQVMQGRDLMLPRLNDDPKCQKCGSKFKPHKKWHLFRGFLVISPQKLKTRREK